MERSAHRFQGVGPDQERGTDLPATTRYDLLATALGCHGEHVAALDDLGGALDRAIASGLPAVLHVEVDPELNVDAIGYEQFQYARTL